MEANTWITKEETSQMTTGLPSCNNGMYGYMDRPQQQQQYSNVRALLQQQSNFYVPDEYGQELDGLNFCLDDFFENGMESDGNAACGKQGLMGTEPMMALTVKTEHLDHSSPDWNTYTCQSPADSGVSMGPSFSPHSDHGSCGSVSPPRNDSASPQSLASSFSGMSQVESNPFMGGQPGDVGFEIYHDLIMRHLVQDIKATCVRLNIPQDPKQWTPSDCRAWLTDMSAQYHLTQVPYEKLSFDGSTLCNMSLAQFNQCFPNGGETVHAQLQIWNSANEYCKRQSSNGTRGLITPADANMILPGCLGSQLVPAVNQQQLIDQQQQYKTMEDDLSGYMAAHLANTFQIQQQQQGMQFDGITGSNAQYNMGTLLPSPGSCSESGSSTDYENGDQTGNNTSNANNIHLWQFLRELLDQQDKYSHCVRWVDHSAGIFKIEDSHKLARLWGQRKNRPAMNYDKLSRSLRQYYKKNILKKTTRSQRLVYQFMHPYHMC